MPRLALIQRAVEPDRDAAHAGAMEAIRGATAEGARIVCLPELYDLPYFPCRMDADLRRFAEPQPSPRVRELGRLAGELGIVLVAPVFEAAAGGNRFNSALVFDADGRELGRYRKNHIPDGPGFHERFYFAPGDSGFPVRETAFGRIGVGICWDSWFPETARVLALGGADLLLFPTALGRELGRFATPEEAWRTLIRGHALANGVFVGVPNRSGVEGPLTFYGGSFVCDPNGEVIAQAGAEPRIVVAELDFDENRLARERMQVFRDRRPDAYGVLVRSA